MPSILILGAGPTGLSAADKLRSLGFEDFLILEREKHPGGLCASYKTPAGFTYDFGGHVLFSIDNFFENWLDDVLDGDVIPHFRNANIYMKNIFIPYPFQNNIHCLPVDDAYDCIAGAIDARLASQKNSTPPHNFKEWLLRNFGEGICRHFMIPYNEKVWATPLDLMGYSWIAERVSMVDPKLLIKNMLYSKRDSSWGPNSRFVFSRIGGTGQIFVNLAKRAGEDKIKYNEEVTEIDVANKKVKCRSGREESYEYLITTIPLDRLISIMRPLPQGWEDFPSKFLHNRVTCFGLGIKGDCPSDKHWTYFSEPNFPTYRVTYLSNYSLFMAPNLHHFCLLCEVAHSDLMPFADGDMKEEVIKGVVKAGFLGPYSRGDIVEVWERTEEYAYPVPFLRRDEILDEVIPSLEEMGIFSRGRFGLWKYEIGNTDHSVIQGIETASLIHSKIAGR
ncbi:MAG: FAD-dependent oxidoreductase [Chloroflexi bacterium]|nr:FAD-dependent oxidoreductase [Chloroflexota bacterium]